MKKAVIYARYSSDMQREESIDAQVRACTYYAHQYQFEILRTYADRAQTGKRTKNREQFLQMIADAENHEFEVILVHKLNRFGRNTLDPSTSMGPASTWIPSSTGAVLTSV